MAVKATQGQVHISSHQMNETVKKFNLKSQEKHD